MLYIDSFTKAICTLLGIALTVFFIHMFRNNKSRSYRRGYSVVGLGVTVLLFVVLALNYHISAIWRPGFYAIATLGMDMTAMPTWELYGPRDEWEKYFQQMKSQLGFDRQRNWSEEGKTGRLLILFVGLILSSYVRHTEDARLNRKPQNWNINCTKGIRTYAIKEFKKKVQQYRTSIKTYSII